MTTLQYLVAKISGGSSVAQKESLFYYKVYGNTSCFWLTNLTLANLYVYSKSGVYSLNQFFLMFFPLNFSSFISLTMTRNNLFVGFSATLLMVELYQGTKLL